MRSLPVDIANSRRSIHVLKSEWSHLNQPHRLRHLAGKYLEWARLMQNASVSGPYAGRACRASRVAGSCPEAKPSIPIAEVKPMTHPDCRPSMNVDALKAFGKAGLETGRNRLLVTAAVITLAFGRIGARLD